MFDVIPEDHRDKARTALSATFGQAAINALRPIKGGASGALVYRAEVGGRAYVLRLEGRRSPMRNPHQYECMQTAAEAGIAPPLRYVDDAAGVVVMDLLPQHPLENYPDGDAGLARDVGALAARLQATPTFPQLGDYLDILARMFAFMSHTFPPGLLDAHAEGFARLREAYRWDSAALVSSHNDPNRSNVLFDGQRLWLIDWETAYRNDPLTDIAIMADNFAAAPDLEEALLHAWLGRAPDRLVRARFMIMRQFTRLYYASLILMGFGAQNDRDLAAPNPVEFAAAIRDGRIVVGVPETTRLMGKIQLAAFLSGLSAPGFKDALSIARQG